MRPCPFCGGDPEMLNGDNTWSQVCCKRCFAKGPEFMLNDAKAVAGWNRRTLPPSEAAPQTEEPRLADLQRICNLNVTQALAVQRYIAALRSSRTPPAQDASTLSPTPERKP